MSNFRLYIFYFSILLIFTNSLAGSTDQPSDHISKLKSIPQNINLNISDIISNLKYQYDDILINRRDVRVDSWFLCDSPVPTLLICISYVLLVKVIGPKFMENREPYDLKNLLIFYNAFQVVFSAWLFYEYGRGGWFHGYSFKCQPVDYSYDPMAMRMLHVCWWYFFSKFTEFVDTFFFVLRKKNQHVSALHVIHHGCMPMSVWFGVKFTPGGHSTFFGLLNTFVHVVMYFYYLLAAMGYRVWWKKYLTNLQMVQFVLIFVHAFQLLFIECNYPKAFSWWIGGHGILFFFLFKSFYYENYSKDSKKLKIEYKSQAKSDEVSNTTTDTSKNNNVNGKKSFQSNLKNFIQKENDNQILRRK